MRRGIVDAKFDRIDELFRRTTLFNDTGRFFSIAELKKLIQGPNAIFLRSMSPIVSATMGLSPPLSSRPRNHGSCHELPGIGYGRRDYPPYPRDFQGCAGPDYGKLTARNTPVRNIYRDNGFRLRDDGTWRWDREEHREQA